MFSTFGNWNPSNGEMDDGTTLNNGTQWMGVLEGSTCTGPSASGEAYFTRDLLTDPPTIVQIVPSLPSAGAIGCRGTTGANGSGSAYAVTFADIEPTAGWLRDRNNATLDICFMHSFGKCSGKAKEKDVRTCHQIHVKREMLNRLRKTYVNPQRNYFCRTMKANITDKFSQVLSLLARRSFTLQYLEFKTDDIDVTSGSTAYEVQYRHWLVSDAAPPKQTEKPLSNTNTINFISTSNLCWDFALTGRCPNGATCPDLHGHVAKALTKDRYVRMALEEMDKTDMGTQSRLNVSQPRQCKPASSAQPPMQHGNLSTNMPTMLSVASAPPEGAELKTLPFQMPSGSLMPPFLPSGGYGLPPNALPSFAAPPPGQNSSQMPMSSAAPFFVVTEGSDKVLRLVPVSALGQFSTPVS